MSGALESLNQAVSTLSRILITPALNPRVALILYAMIAVLLLIILVVGLIVVMAAPDDEPAASVSAEAPKAPRKERRAKRPVSGKARLLLGLGIVVVLAGVWLVAGNTTSDSGLCKGCHWPSAAHAKADKSTDPHTRVDCVACHEPGGVLGRYVTDVPVRILHIAMASTGAGNEKEYGKATTRACTSCHAASLSGTKTNAERGLKVSHAEPMAASASCLDCHAMRGGVVSVHNAGMQPCLRCHDGNKVSSACPTCHTEKGTAAARARTTSFQNAQIRDVSCSGCHNEKQNCDPCHGGTRMPHTSAFKAGAHARAAAVDIWYNDGKSCRRCHTASSRPCTACHSSLMGRAHGGTSAMAVSHQSATSSGCDSCHLQYAPIATRDFCKDICHSPAAKAASPR